MAGIGFELRKIYGKETLASNIWGSVYAAFTTIGPTILFAGLVLSLKMLMDYYHASERESMFFISSFTYVFLTAILISSLMNTILSRYISDQIFSSKENKISAAVLGSITIGSILSGMVMLFFCIRMYMTDIQDIEFLIVYYWLGILATNAYNLITFVSGLKEYKKVTGGYFLGLLLSIPTFFICYFVLGLELIMAAYCALVFAFFATNMMLIFVCLKAFGKPDREYMAFIRYFGRFPRLVVSGFSYMLGFYISSVIYWNFSDMQAQVSIFRTSPKYDLAMFLAIVVNMPALVIFVVKTETVFFEKYVNYLSALSSGSYKIIEKEQDTLGNTIRLQLFFVYEVQFIITVLLVILANVFFPYLSISSQALNMFTVLAIGLYSTFCMYFTVIFLYYFEDHKASMYGPLAFCIITIVLALVASQVGKPYYPLPILIGAITGWIISYLALRDRLKNLDKFLMCR
ncbi:MAG: exopolysaccharide Pel transporter PelG [Lachnospiraceae bacterium]